MRSIWAIQTLALFFLLSSGAYAITGLGMGVRGGMYTSYNNEDLEFDSFDVVDIDQLTMFGGHLRITTLPIFTFELVGEYSWKSENFTIDVGGLRESVEVKVRDFMVGLNAKYEFDIPALTPYVGGGLATHQLTYEISDLPSGFVPFGGQSLIAPEDGPQFGMHALAGVKLGVPASPIEFFAEGRIGRITGDDGATTYTMIYGGVTLSIL